MLKDLRPLARPSRRTLCRMVGAALLGALILAPGEGRAGAEGGAEVLFSIRGLSGETAAAGHPVTRAVLEALSQESYVTATVWTDGAHRFSGVLLAVFLDWLGASDCGVEIVALDGYVITIPAGDIAAEAPLLATRIDGSPISRRDRGPVWLVYPYDRAPRFRTEIALARSVWQIDYITLLPPGVLHPALPAP
jgi:hypothetical protein